jgi:hypothetical protein
MFGVLPTTAGSDDIPIVECDSLGDGDVQSHCELKHL